ncbi:MAG: hypothetical protein AAB363_02175 [Planctomycetota bacterium]
MVRIVLRRLVLAGLPLLSIILASGCHSPGHPGHSYPCSGCGRAQYERPPSEPLGESQQEPTHPHS